MTTVGQIEANKDVRSTGLAVPSGSPSAALAKLEAVRDPEIQRRVMAAMGRRGGQVGGKARAEKLSPARRKEIATLAAWKRWGKTPPMEIPPCKPGRPTCACGFIGNTRNIRPHRMNCTGWAAYCAQERQRLNSVNTKLTDAQRSV